MVISPSLRRIILASFLGLFVLVMFSRELTRLLTEFWWYGAAGYAQVIRTLLSWQAGIGLAAFVTYALVLSANYALARRNISRSAFRFTAEADRTWVFSRRQLPRGVAPAAIAAISFIAAASSATYWTTVAQYWHAASFDRPDPIFGLDLGFYVFKLPFFEGLVSWLLVLTTVTLGAVGLLYGISGAIDTRRGWQQFVYGSAKVHLSSLVAGAIALIAAGFWLERYNLLYSTAGVVYGAGFTDTHARLLALTVLTVVSLGLAGTFIFAAGRPSFRVQFYGAGIYLAAYVLLLVIFPVLQQETFVAPNELDKEQPYIDRNIVATLQGYDLDAVEGQSFKAEANLDRDAIGTNQPTIDNVRLWDDRPLLATYRQIQEFRPYYRFRDADIDRYTLGNDYRQVLLAARENAWSGSPEAKNWFNQHFFYTHGYGIAMSPANRVTPQGLPELFVRDIPPIATHPALEITRPGIYYGEYGPDDNSYIFTGGVGADELDYSATGDTEGDSDAVLTRYDGLGGVPIPGFGQRLAYAYIFSDVKMLLSSYFGPETRVHYHRDVRQRVQRLMPFLHFDSDPYLVTIDGELKWIVDGYTTSDRYPYSEPMAEVLQREEYPSPIGFRRNFNYIRNSVKAVVDAYDGSATFYAIDPGDPLLQAYRGLFPGLLVDDVPPALRAHFRYPLDLFRAQALVYSRYHMRDPRSFYNQEDLWRFPNTTAEIPGVGSREVPIEPYYAIVRLPGGDREEFVTILPFTPAKKLPMVAWLAARSDGENYGKLLLYEFPKQERVFGPQQIEARIDQNTTISQQLTLWDQQGSQVVRGNITVIPIEESLLYVEPIYLRAENQGLPELKRVIVAYGDDLAMEQTLEEALAKVLGFSDLTPPIPDPTPTESAEPLPIGDRPELVRRAQGAFQAAKAAAEQGDWSVYGERLNELEELLQELGREATASE